MRADIFERPFITTEPERGDPNALKVTFYLQQVNLRDLGSKIDLPPFSVAVSNIEGINLEKKNINSDNF